MPDDPMEIYRANRQMVICEGVCNLTMTAVSQFGDSRRAGCNTQHLKMKPFEVNIFSNRLFLVERRLRAVSMDSFIVFF
jgi:hypothetical protein